LTISVTSSKNKIEGTFFAVSNSSMAIFECSNLVY
jgi:hypothetical protein